jgi:NAD(P)-dependent dehydrogenase (short-subunit alcohol dehydrogenase family)
VLRLAGEGAHVVVNARSNQQEAETVAREARDLGVKAVPILADVGKKAEVEALAARALSVGNDFQQPRGNQGFRHFHMSTISTPTGGRPPLNVAGQPRP